jgi:hypothetical protein
MNRAEELTAEIQHGQNLWHETSIPVQLLKIRSSKLAMASIWKDLSYLCINSIDCCLVIYIYTYIHYISIDHGELFFQNLNLLWLVVLTILKSMKVNGKDYPIYCGKYKSCLTPPTSYFIYHLILTDLIDVFPRWSWEWRRRTRSTSPCSARKPWPWTPMIDVVRCDG